MGKPNYIYIGPSIPPLGLKRNTIYRVKELPAPLLQIHITKPVVGALYISTRDLAEANKRITKKGTLEYTANKEMLAIAKSTPH